jgi:hypothetical protein
VRIELGLWRNPLGLTLIASILLAVRALAESSSPIPRDLVQFLQEQAGMSPGDLTALESGRTVTRVLPHHNKGELAVAAAARIRVPMEFFLNSFRHLPTVARGPQTLTVQVFSDPPRESDLRGVTLEPQDLKDLSKCVPGNCGLKLSAEMMEQIRGTAGGSGAAEPEGLNILFRHLLFEYVTAYLRKGNSALITYTDKLPPVPSLDAFLGLLEEFELTRRDAQPLYECLSSYSGQPCPAVESLLYWSNAKFGLKPVLTINDMLTYKTVRNDKQWAFLALKQMYADHYFVASLGVLILMAESEAPDPKLWVVYVNRSQTDGLQGLFGPLKRDVVEHKSRATAQKDLVELKGNLETQYQKQQ